MTTQAEPSADPQAERARQRVGTVLQDKWHLDSLLGLGGMAAVYAATHRNGKRVAVKMLHAEFNHDDDIQTRFLQEGYAANTIGHEGAVSVLDDDVAPDGSAYLVMELLEGETVEQRWESRGRRLPLSEVLAVGDQLLDVLAAAHEKSVLHRDVKPENLFVTKTGLLKVLDFGIARVRERQTRSASTRSGMVMGTPAFMAPEQARARWDEVDPRTDLWAAGATMFTLLTGRYVHEAPSSQEQLITSATTTAPSLAAIAPETPPAVVAIVDRALSFDRSERWPDARSMQEAVRAALEATGAKPLLGQEATPISASVRSLRMSFSDATTFTAPAGTSEATWVAERDARQAEADRVRTKIGETTVRYEDAKKRATTLQTELDSAAEERKSLEQWFDRRVGRRTAAVEQAREEVRQHFLTLGRRALDDKATFGAGLDEVRAQVATLERARESAARDVLVHKLALRAYDAPSLRAGLVTGVIGALLALALIAGPIVWRATRVVEPPHTSAPAHH
jgi:hypothetical protein